MLLVLLSALPILLLCLVKPIVGDQPFGSLFAGNRFSHRRNHLCLDDQLLFSVSVHALSSFATSMEGSCVGRGRLSSASERLCPVCGQRPRWT